MLWHGIKVQCQDHNNAKNDLRVAECKSAHTVWRVDLQTHVECNIQDASGDLKGSQVVIENCKVQYPHRG